MVYKEILINSIKNGYAPIMAQKIIKRLFEHENKESLKHNLFWCHNASQDFEKFAVKLDKKIYEECKKFEEDLYSMAKNTLEKVGVELGGGGHYPFLYFITRYRRPEYIVETGVAAGYSTQAFLKALNANATGVLLSSDFPYFRIKNPEQYIGILVDEALKGRWKLFTKGDKINLPQIALRIPQVDIFHYDSDKTYSGRLFAMQILEKLFISNTIIIMDDIQDNHFFYNYVKKNNSKYRVFNFFGKYVGVIGI